MVLAVGSWASVVAAAAPSSCACEDPLAEGVPEQWVVAALVGLVDEIRSAETLSAEGVVAVASSFASAFAVVASKRTAAAVSRKRIRRKILRID